MQQHAPYHWVHQFNSIVLRRVMTRSNHDSNGLPMQLPGPKGCQQADSENDRI